MKLLYSAILALAATGAQAQNSNPTSFSSGEKLKEAWNMDEAVITYNKGDNEFTLTFNTTSVDSAFDSGVHINEEFYDYDCADQDGSGEVVIHEGIVDPSDNTHRPEAYQKSITGEVVLNFELLPDILSQNATIYEDDGQGKGTLKFCVRTSLGYGGEASPTGLDYNLKEQKDAGFKEVNFIESLITVEYNLTSGFETVAATVEPKDRFETTAQEDSYGLIAWICDISKDYTERTYPVGTTGRNIERSYPQSLDFESFNQGALIPVCISPDEDAYAEGVVMNKVNNFKWTRADSPILGLIKQDAIVNGATDDNRLTYHTGCVGDDYCLIQSILFADFYITLGSVVGSGDATVQFEQVRRLGESRKLQEIAGGSPFELSVALSDEQDGPSALKTAGGVSLGLTALASAVALASAALMA